MKSFLRLTIFSIALAGMGAAIDALAQGYPVKPVHLIVPFAAGGTGDVLGRLLASKMSEGLGQPVVVEFKPGAGTTLGTDFVAKSPPDGYTILFSASTTMSINATLYGKLPYDTLRDLAPVSMLASIPNMLVANHALPANTVQELIALAKANPGKLNYGTSGPGSSPHLAAELFASMAGITMTHVPYKGVAPYITAELGNEVQLSYANMFSTMPHWKSGRLRLIAVTGPTRSQTIPDVPTVAETLPGYEALIWYGYLAPAKTPRPIIDKLHREIAAIVNTPEVRQYFIAQGNDPVANTPAEFANVIKADADKWGAIGKRLGVKLD